MNSQREHDGDRPDDQIEDLPGQAQDAEQAADVKGGIIIVNSRAGIVDGTSNTLAAGGAATTSLLPPDPCVSLGPSR